MYIYIYDSLYTYIYIYTYRSIAESSVVCTFRDVCFSDGLCPACDCSFKVKLRLTLSTTYTRVAMCHILKRSSALHASAPLD